MKYGFEKLYLNASTMKNSPLGLIDTDRVLCLKMQEIISPEFPIWEFFFFIYNK